MEEEWITKIRGENKYAIVQGWYTKGHTSRFNIKWPREGGMIRFSEWWLCRSHVRRSVLGKLICTTVRYCNVIKKYIEFISSNLALKPVNVSTRGT